MKDSKAIRQSLITSVLALIVCCAMLVGATFAWFNVNSESGGNKIVAGNLNVDLQYAVRESDGTISKWKDINGNMFSDVLWEQGHTEVVYIRIHNNGELALTYDLSALITGKNDKYKNVEGKEVSLSEFLVFNVISDSDEIVKFESRESAWLTDTDDKKEETAALGNIDPLKIENERLDPNGEKIITMAVYMPTRFGNEVNYDSTENAPEIGLQLQLIARQMSDKSDSSDKTNAENAQTE